MMKSRAYHANSHAKHTQDNFESHCGIKSLIHRRGVFIYLVVIIIIIIYLLVILVFGSMIVRIFA